MPSKKSVGVPMGTRAVAGHPAGPPHPRGYPATRPGVCDPDPTPIPPDQGPAARVPSTRGRSPGVVPDPAVVAGRGASSLLPLERMRPAGRASPAAVTAHPRRTGRPYPIRRRPERSPTMRRARGVAPDPGHLRAPGPAAPVHAPAAGSSRQAGPRIGHTSRPPRARQAAGQARASPPPPAAATPPPGAATTPATTQRARHAYAHRARYPSPRTPRRRPVMHAASRVIPAGLEVPRIAPAHPGRRDHPTPTDRRAARS